jgi:citrate lyase subunit beta/citryl-CoA lyase
MLFLPGNNPNMLANGDILGSDAVIFDLEDAVAPDEKDAARILVRNALTHLDFSRVEVIVRINSIDDTGFWQRDLEEIIPLRPSLVLPTKVPDAESIHALSRFAAEIERKHGIPEGTTGFIPLIETAPGLENSFHIAKADPRVKAMLLGAEDLTADLHCVRTKEGNEIAYARGRIVTAARAAGIDIYDTPFTDVNDDEGLLADARLAKSLGFTGKAAISPRHVKAINAVFTPTQAEIEYAREVLRVIGEAKAQGKGAISLYGKMIDAPIVARAEQVLETAKASGLVK